ncbi:hypothetical protein [Halobellus rubicundus]|uniref:Uncharacterized protein n=1 Tax=Halobellus rubicundus TaxID=2996466 RepID=A0ABD5MIR2_9EURY
MSPTVKISQEDGEYTAVDSETGEVGVGSTRAMALAELAVRLGSAEQQPDADTEDEVRKLVARTRARFDREEVTEDDVEDAIEWARSE